MSEDVFYSEGYEAYYDGAERTDNPYHQGTDGYHGWNLGWDAADEEVA